MKQQEIDTTKIKEIISKRHSQGFVTGLFGLVANLGLGILKLVAGSVTGSVALLADGVNNMVDASSSLVVIFGFAVARRQSDAGHPHGHGRAEYIGGMCISFLIFVTMVLLARTSIQHIIQPAPVNFSTFALVALVISIIAKLLMAVVYAWRNRQLQSVLVRAALRDSLSDAVISGVVLAAALIARSTDLAIDGVAGLVVVAFVAYQAVRAFLDSLDLLLGRAADPKKLTAIRRIVLRQPAFEKVVGIDYHDYGESYHKAYIKVKVKKGLRPEQVRRDIENVDLELMTLQNVKATIVYWY